MNRRKFLGTVGLYTAASAMEHSGITQKIWLPQEVLQLRYEEHYPERFSGESKYLEKIM